MADSSNRTRPESLPHFRLPDSKGHVLELESFLHKTAMVFVFLDHLSERDRRVLHEIDSRLSEFGSQRTQALVVMSVSARNASQMAEELDLSVPVLADENGEMARDFGVAAPSGDGNRSVGIVADKRGSVRLRVDSLGEDEEATEVVDALLEEVSRVASDAHPIDSDDEFYARLAEEARVSGEDAPALVRAFLSAVAPSLGKDARAVVSELAPEGMEIPEVDERDGQAGVEALLQAALDDSSIASGRPAEHARVVAEALRSRADESQLRRLVASVDDEDVLSLFETDGGELTAHHLSTGVSELSQEAPRDSGL